MKKPDAGIKKSKKLSQETNKILRVFILLFLLELTNNVKTVDFHDIVSEFKSYNFSSKEDFAEIKIL